MYGHYPRPPYPPHQQPHGYGYPPADPFRAWYADRLAELTFNSRPIITTLSIEAAKQRDQNNWPGMQAVVEEIEGAVLRAPPQGKLPLLYLIDSISKNVGSPYTDQLFAATLPDVYIQTYREVDGVTKSKMEEMLKLWRTGGRHGSELYPTGVREAVEREIFGSAGAPLSQQGVQTQLREFLREKEDEMAQEFSTARARTVNVLVQIDQLLTSTQVPPQDLADIVERLRAMKAGLDPSSANIGRQAAPAAAAAPPVAPPPAPPVVAPVAAPFGQPAFNPRNAYPPPQPAFQPAPPAAAFPPAHGGNSPFAQPGYGRAAPQPAGHVPTPPPGPPAAPTAIPAIPLNVADILRNLNNSGVLSQPRTPEPPAAPAKMGLDSYEDMILALGMTIDVLDLTKLSLPVSHMPVRCKQCGLRFPEGENKKLQEHMDWHFRRNRKERETEGRGAHRRWLPSAEEWINGAVEAGPSSPSKPKEEPAKVTAERTAALARKWVPAPSDPTKAAVPCPMCKEQFKSQWSEDEEEWVFMNAVKVGNTIYHATCYEEKKASLVARRLLAGERSASKSPAPELSPGTKRKVIEEEGEGEGEDAKRVKVEADEKPGDAEAKAEAMREAGHVGMEGVEGEMENGDGGGNDAGDPAAAAAEPAVPVDATPAEVAAEVAMADPDATTVKIEAA